VVVPDGHPLLSTKLLTLEDLATWPLITYDQGFTGRGHIDEAFRAKGLETDIVLTAMDSDVIQQYVALGMGVGIVASMAVEHNRNPGLKAIPANHLFALNTTRVAVRRGAYLRAYMVDFILQLAPQLGRAEILAAV
jgi:LysR family cys regulon transcriptional activator